jgi:hypothetical protein
MNNVIVLSAYKYEKQKKKNLLEQKQTIVQEDKKENTLAPTYFDDLIKKNKAIEEKLKEERKHTNTNVKKSYRLE